MQAFERPNSWLVMLVVASCFTILHPIASVGQERVVLENSKTGVYKALAQLSFESFKKGDMATAATLARILDRTWDQIEESGEHGLNKANPKLFEEIDEPMDTFIKPIIHYKKKTPDAVAVESAYKTYIAKLKTVE